MDAAVLTSEEALAAVSEDWRLLDLRAARFPFADPALFAAWWRLRGRKAGCKLHVVTGRQDGRLVALAPQVVTRRWGLRVLEWGGGEVFDYCDALLEAPSWGAPLWDAIRHSGLYDFALLREIHPAASCRHFLCGFAQQVRSRHVSCIRFEWPSGGAWMQHALSASTRAFYRRAERRLAAHGPLRFEICRDTPLPTPVLRALIRQKVAWLHAHAKQSWLSDDAAIGACLLDRIAEAAASNGRLHLCWLQCGDEIIATHLGLVHQKIFYWYIPAYDVGWAKFAPGRLLLLKLIEWAIDEGLSGFDFMRGEEAYKAQLANDHRDLMDVIFAGSHIARLAERSLIAWYLRRHAGVPAEVRATDTSAIEPVS